MEAGSSTGGWRWEAHGVILLDFGREQPVKCQTLPLQESVLETAVAFLLEALVSCLPPAPHLWILTPSLSVTSIRAALPLRSEDKCKCLKRRRRWSKGGFTGDKAQGGQSSPSAPKRAAALLN